jgi:hypothetical protein
VAYTVAVRLDFLEQTGLLQFLHHGLAALEPVETCEASFLGHAPVVADGLDDGRLCRQPFIRRAGPV